MNTHTYQDKVMDFFAAVSVEWWGAGQEHVRNNALISKRINIESYIDVKIDVKISVKVRS